MPGDVQTVGVRKEYPGTLALDDVSVRFAGGQVHALLGKNGAGKSTLVKILAGTVEPTAGRLLVNGREVRLRSAGDAFRQGIATVYQELSLIPGLTVAENILLGRLPHRRLLGLRIIDWPAAVGQARAVMADLGVELDVRRRVDELSVAQQQVVEIAKAMSFRPTVLMLDEPTSALAQHEVDNLFGLVRQLAAKGVAVVYITHRLQELPRLADTVTVLRDGRLAGVVPIAEATPERIVSLMFGTVTQRPRPTDLRVDPEAVLEVRDLGRAGAFHDVTFDLHRGEVLGIAGMLGSGRTELLRALFGAEPPESGTVRLHGRPLQPRDPRTMCRHGLAYTPEDRQHDGLVPELSTHANLVLASLDRVSRLGVTTRRRERPGVQRLIERLAIHVTDPDRAVAALSGGNQQKVVVGKWLARQPAVILLDEPTRGIDVLAKRQIFEIVWDLSRAGVGCLMVSSELEELLEVCHRVLIMGRGTIRGEVRPGDVTADELYRRCLEA